MKDRVKGNEGSIELTPFLQKSFATKRKRFVRRYMHVWRTTCSFMGALSFLGQLSLTFPMIHKKWKNFNVNTKS